jgi:hypothetical protein
VKKTSLPGGSRRRQTSRKRRGTEREVRTSGPFKNEMLKKQASEIKNSKTDKEKSASQ